MSAAIDTLRWILASIGGLVVLSASMSCQSRFGLEPTGGEGGAETSTTSAGGHTGTGGGGAASRRCTGAADCEPASNACAIVACRAGACTTVDLAAGSFVAADSPPDCRATICDGHGHLTSIVDKTNIALPDNPCLDGGCDASGAQATTPKPAGAACASPGGGRFCDGAGQCLACLDDGDCPSHESCGPTHTCVSPSCADGLTDGHETDLDCGGGTCPACADGSHCLQGSDCTSGICDAANHTCNASSCDDGYRNGDETDVDCGGSCPACALHQDCLLDQDCQSGACDATWPRRCIADFCHDHHYDGDETAPDCGGSCSPCGALDACRIDHDCQSGHCDGGFCKSLSCYDGIKDDGESGVDCGNLCPRCDLGQGCDLGSDCASTFCDALTRLCVSEHCGDHVIDGGETDADCGGPTACPRCGLDEYCQSAADCLPGLGCSASSPHVCE